MLQAGHNRNLTLRTSGAGKVNINLNDLSSLATKLGNQRQEHSGAALAERLESVESTISGNKERRKITFFTVHIFMYESTITLRCA